MKVSVVILNWLDPKDALRSLKSAMDALRGLPSEFIVVENGARSHVDVPDTRSIQHIVLGTNVGVARGRNAGIAAGAGEYVLILDDDCYALEGAHEFVDFMDRHPAVGVAGPLIVDSYGRTMNTCRRFPTVADKIARRVPGRWSDRVLNESEFSYWDHQDPAFVDYVIGAAQLLRREALNDVGFYDNDFFYGPEDVDLCLRMWQQGWQVAYFPAARIVHDERRMTTRLSRLTMRHVGCLARYYHKHRYLLSRRRLYRRLGSHYQASTWRHESERPVCLL